MKKIFALVILTLSLFLFSCELVNKDASKTSEPDNKDTERVLEDLDATKTTPEPNPEPDPNGENNPSGIVVERYRYDIYLNLSTMKGLDVYFYMLDDEYNFVMLSGTNRNKTVEEISTLQKNYSCPLDEFKNVLSKYSSEDLESIYFCEVSYPVNEEDIKDHYDDYKKVNEIRNLLGLEEKTTYTLTINDETGLVVGDLKRVFFGGEIVYIKVLCATDVEIVMFIDGIKTEDYSVETEEIDGKMMEYFVYKLSMPDSDLDVTISNLFIN